MLALLGKKKLIKTLKNKKLSPALKYEIKQIIRTYKLNRKEIIDSATQAIEFWEELREYENSSRLEKYFLGHAATDSEEEFQTFSKSGIARKSNNDESEPQHVDFVEPDEDPYSYSPVEEVKELSSEEADEAENSFDDDLVYVGFFTKRKLKGVKDYLVLGEDEYDIKRNRHLFFVCFMMALPVSFIFTLLGALVFDSLGFLFEKIWLVPIIFSGGFLLAYLFYTVLSPQDLVWTYDRVITMSYTLVVTYICVILFGVAVGVFVAKSDTYILRRNSYFKVDNYKTYVEKNPNSAEGRMKLAYAYMSNEDSKNALKEITEALKISPDLEPALDLQRAIIGLYFVYKEAVIHFANGMLYWFIEQDPSALEEFQKAIDIYPKFGAAHYYIACIYYSQQEYEKSWKHALEARSAQYFRVKNLINELQKYFEVPQM